MYSTNNFDISHEDLQEISLNKELLNIANKLCIDIIILRKLLPILLGRHAYISETTEERKHTVASQCETYMRVHLRQFYYFKRAKKGFGNEYDEVVYYFLAVAKSYGASFNTPQFALQCFWNIYIEVFDVDLRGMETIEGEKGYHFLNADLSGVTLLGSFKGVSLKGANLSNCNCENASRFVLDNCLVRNTLFAANSNDAYSILRNTYSGPKFLIMLAISVLAMLPHLAKGFVPQHEKVKVYTLVLDFNRGSLAAITTIALVLYSVLRAVVTLKVTAIRDVEERANKTPSREAYYPEEILMRPFSLYFIHRYFLRYIFWFAVWSAGFKLLNWLRSDAPRRPEWTNHIEEYKQDAKKAYEAAKKVEAAVERANEALKKLQEKVKD